MGRSKRQINLLTLITAVKLQQQQDKDCFLDIKQRHNFVTVNCALRNCVTVAVLGMYYRTIKP